MNRAALAQLVGHVNAWVARQRQWARVLRTTPPVDAASPTTRPRVRDKESSLTREILLSEDVRKELKCLRRQNALISTFNSVDAYSLKGKIARSISVCRSN